MNAFRESRFAPGRFLPIPPLLPWLPFRPIAVPLQEQPTMPPLPSFTMGSFGPIAIPLQEHTTPPLPSFTMGSFGNEWRQCDWCGWWGKPDWDAPDHMALIEVDGYTLMHYCLRCCELEEPPWYPNNRQRCADWFLKISRGLPDPDHRQVAAAVSGTIAKFLASSTK